MSDAAAWAQAYLSAAAILVSGALAVFVPWNERRLARHREDRARLGIEVRRSNSGGLEVNLRYTPEFQNYAIGASITILSPSGARVYKGISTKHVADDGCVTDERRIGALGQNVRYNAISLQPSENTNYLYFEGLMLVEYPDERPGPFSAEVRIDILYHGNYRILSRKVRISAIDDEYYSHGGPIAVIVGKRDF